jgi:hypothetical protein
MSDLLRWVRRKFRKQLHKYWQKSLPLRLHTLDMRFLRFVSDYLIFSHRNMQSDRRFTVRWSERLACLQDRTTSSDFDARSVYRLAWAARVLAHVQPSLHLDFRSELVFSAMVSAFLPVWRFDTEPVRISLSGLECGVTDPHRFPLADGSMQSVSSIGAIEHAGLGRYGEALDPDGDLAIMHEMLRVLGPDGTLLIAVPVGSARICFNAYRIYAFQDVRYVFGGLQLKQFSLIDDTGRYWPHASAAQADAQQDGYGCWWFVR